MDSTKIVNDTEQRFKQAVEHFKSETNKLRTGRAHPSMVEDVMVEAYGVKTPLKQLATISTPEAQLIQISPFDPATMADISAAIRNNQTLGLNPADDGRIVRIQIPALTEERRQLIVKQLGEKQEDAFISLRKSRHDAMSSLDKAKKDKSLSEDDAKRLQQSVEESMNESKRQMEAISANKEKEITTV